MELMVRVAGKKYNVGKLTERSKPETCKTYYQAFVKLIDEHLKPNARTYDDMEFRLNHLWKYDVNEVFVYNKTAIDKILKILYTKPG